MKKRNQSSEKPSPGYVQEELGSGITKGTRTRFSGPLNAEAASLLIETLERASNCPIATIEEDLRAFLREAGIPDDPTEGGKHPFRSHVTEELKKAERISGPWYAAAVLDQLAQVRRVYEVTRGDENKRAVYNAALAGLWAGALYKEAAMKFEWEPDALLGQADRQSRKRGGETTGKRTSTEARGRNKPVLEMNEKLLSKHPAERERAAIIARKLKRPESSIRSIIRSK